MISQSILWTCSAGLALLLGACLERASSVPPLANARHKEAADLVLSGGELYTMHPQMPRAEAVAIRDGRIAAVGSAGEMRAHAGPHTRWFELHGRAVTPGLVDAHCHLYGLGIALETVS